MKPNHSMIAFCTLFLLFSTVVIAQQSAPTATDQEITVPNLIKFAGTLKEPDGLPRVGTINITFGLYASQEGGAPLWNETQVVQTDADGNFSIYLGASEKTGLPLDLFSTEKARWLGVQIQDEEEQARVLFVAVPYALKAADADTVGGKPASSFVLFEDLGKKQSSSGKTLSPLALEGGSPAYNTLYGTDAGASLTTGSNNSFFGKGAGASNTSGSGNSFVGFQSGLSNTAENNNTFIGANSTGAAGITNATAIGYGAQVTQSNSLVLGSINGVNGATADTNVGIGTTNPSQKLDVQGGNIALGPNQIIGSGQGFGCPGCDQRGTIKLYDSATGYTTVQSGTYYGLLLNPNGGNVGMGTTSPSQKLDVQGGNIALGPNQIIGSGQGFGCQGCQQKGTIKLYDSATGYTTVQSGTYYGLLLNPNGGNVGIGTSSPTSKLTVAGDIESSTGFKISGSSVIGTSGIRNVFAGAGAGLNNITGTDNAFFGNNAGQANTAGSSNAILGQGAGYSNTANDNSFFGRDAGYGSTSGSLNSFLGRAAGYSNSTGNYNALFGGWAGYSNTASGNSIFGTYAGQTNTSGANNSIFGYLAGYANGTASNNAIFGQAAGQNNTGNNIAFFGQAAGQANTANNNSFFGYYAGNANTSGIENSFFGYYAGKSNTTGTKNSYFGHLAGNANQTATGNAFFGTYSGIGTTSGSNSFFGYASGQSNASGGFNTFVGAFAGFYNTTGQGNSFFGDSTGYAITTESNNSIFGASANLAVGVTNGTAIGNHAKVTQSNSLVLGSINGVNGATADVNVGIGTTSPSARLHVQNGDILIGSPGQGIILKSPDGTKCAKFTIDNSGSVVTALQACP